MRRAFFLIFALLGATLIACGGGDDGDSGDGDSPATAAATTSADGNDDGGGDDGGSDDDAENDDADGDDSEGDDDGIDFGDGTASVTIGDVQYDFDFAAGFTVCRDVFGIIQVAGPSADGRDIKVGAEISPTDWATYSDGRYDPPSIFVEDDEQDVVWIASASWAAEYGIEGSSQIDSYEKDGITASGTATFIDRRAIQQREGAEPITGSFRVSCSEE